MTEDMACQKFMSDDLLMENVIRIISTTVSRGGRVVDLMCGFGMLPGSVKNKRNDLNVRGVDSNSYFISCAAATYKDVEFINADIFEWQNLELNDAVSCSRGFHHIEPERRKDFIHKMASLLKPGGICIVTDAFIAHYSNEKERRLAAMQLGNERVRVLLETQTPDERIKMALELLQRDLFVDGEYKVSVKMFKEMIRPAFTIKQCCQVWPERGSYGDYYFILQKPAE